MLQLWWSKGRRSLLFTLWTKLKLKIKILSKYTNETFMTKMNLQLRVHCKNNSFFIRQPFDRRLHLILLYYISFVLFIVLLFLGTPVFSTSKTDRHDITETFLKVALNTINQPLSFSLIYLLQICKSLYDNQIFNLTYIFYWLRCTLC